MERAALRLEEVGSRAQRAEGAGTEDSLEEQKQCGEKGSVEGGRGDPMPGRRTVTLEFFLLRRYRSESKERGGGGQRIPGLTLLPPL